MSGAAHTLRVWCPDDREEPPYPNEGGAPGFAAEREAERRFYRGDFPAVQTIHVRDERGSLHRYEVTTDSVPVFTARKRAVS